MGTLADYVNQVELLVHDLNQIDWSPSEYASRINQARTRVALDTHCFRNFFTGLNVIQGVEQYPIKGGIAGIVIQNGGQNYINPKVVFRNGGGSGAAAALTTLNGVIIGAQMTSWGTGYTSTPDAVIIDGVGFVTNWQLRQALAALTTPANASFFVFNAIQALPVGDPIFIQWNSGAGSVFGDALSALIMGALPATQQQVAALYDAAAAYPTITAQTFGGPGQIGATSNGQTGLVPGQPPPFAPLSTTGGVIPPLQPLPGTVTNQQFRLALADPTYSLAQAFFGAISSSPSDPANMIFNSGAATAPGDPLSAVLTGSLGMQDGQMADFYAFAATKTNSPLKVTNQQLRRALADPSYAMISAVTTAISFSPADPVNIQWNSGAGTQLGDALATLISTLAFPGGKNVASLYAFALTFPAGSPGYGATAQAISLHNVLDINIASMIWGSQRVTLRWFPFSTFQAYCRSYTAVPSGPPEVWSEYWENNILFLFRIPDQVYTFEIDAICLPDPLVNSTDIETQIPPPCDELVQYWAAHLCLLKIQQFDQANYYEQKYTRRLKQIQGTRFSVRHPNIYANREARLRRGM